MRSHRVLTLAAQAPATVRTLRPTRSPQASGGDVARSPVQRSTMREGCKRQGGVGLDGKPSYDGDASERHLSCERSSPQRSSLGSRSRAASKERHRRKACCVGWHTTRRGDDPEQDGASIAPRIWSTRVKCTASFRVLHPWRDAEIRPTASASTLIRFSERQPSDHRGSRQWRQFARRSAFRTETFETTWPSHTGGPAALRPQIDLLGHPELRQQAAHVPAHDRRRDRTEHTYAHSLQPAHPCVLPRARDTHADPHPRLEGPAVPGAQAPRRLGLPVIASHVRGEILFSRLCGSDAACFCCWFAACRSGPCYEAR